MKKIAIIGSNGFVGKALVRTAKNFNFEVTCVTRENFSEHKNKSYDCVINSAMPSKRFWSLNNPIEDIKETVVKTADIFYNWHYDKFVQISSISAEKNPVKFVGESSVLMISANKCKWLWARLFA